MTQAERWGSELITEDVEFLDLKHRPFTVRSSEVEVCFAFNWAEQTCVILVTCSSKPWMA